MNRQIVSRIAPTPSGFLHVGNAVNFLLTWLAVRSRNGILHLRIDDLDRMRCKPEYIDDIFHALEWLNVQPDAGPSGTQNFLTHYSQTHRYDLYKKTMMQMRSNGAHLFACSCSRKTLSSTPLYPGTCRNLEKNLLPYESAMRIAVPEDTEILIGDTSINLGRTMGDFVLWRRDDIPAYQLVSVIEDQRMGVNLLVRGKDLLQSSAAQRFLAPYLNADSFMRATMLHHDLLLRPDGSKYSKSDADYSLRQMRMDMGSTNALHHIYAAAQQLLGLEPITIDRPEALLHYALSSASSSEFLQTI